VASNADLPMDPLVTHRHAQDVFAGVLAGVRSDQLGNPSPCAEWDARAVIQHVIGGNQWVQQRATLRGPGRSFGDERPCPEGGSPADELAAFLGRDVCFTPS
jgi:uncharacterized protein (TIGR03083 family)